MADDTLRPADEARESKVDVDQGAPTSPNGEAHGDARDAETDAPKNDTLTREDGRSHDRLLLG